MQTNNPQVERDLAQLRADLQAPGTLSIARMEKAYRRLCEIEPAGDITVAWLANHTVEPVVRAAVVAAFAEGVVIRDHVGPFDQYFQSILDADSELMRLEPQVIVLLLSLRGLDEDLVTGGAGLAADERQARADAVVQRVDQWVSQARQRTRATLLIGNFPRPPRPPLGLADLRSPVGEGRLIAQLNLRLADAYRDDSRVHVLDVELALAASGSLAAWNPGMYRLAKVEWDGIAAQSVGRMISRNLCALVRPARKCLVVDLDNTLWGGVVGEDGPRGIRIGEGDPIGESYLAFQRALKDLRARGILLAICSKNNPEDVSEAFSQRSMPLAWGDFAATRINWDNKPDNIRDIARELNIGLDSVAFVDDSPVECELVRQLLPEVRTIQLPSDPAAYADLLLDSWDFDKLVVTEEDTRKTEQYRENAARSTAQSHASDLTAYLEGLETRVRILSAGPAELARAHQLFSKTNQFNVTTQRYLPAQVEEFSRSPEWRLELFHASDKYGDLGIIGVVLLRLGPDAPEVDSIVLSCRAMGRGIETVMCNRVKHIAFQEGQAQRLMARFVPTRKNSPAARLFESQGFELGSETPDGTRHFGLERQNSVELPVPGIASIELEVRREHSPA